MKVKATVKVFNEPKQRTDRTGHDYMQQILILEARDGEQADLWAVSLRDDLQQRVKELGIQQGSQVVADLSFETYYAQSGYVGNKVGIRALSPAFPVSGKEPLRMGTGCNTAEAEAQHVTDYGFAPMAGFNPTTMM